MKTGWPESPASPFSFLYSLPIINGAGLLLAHGAVVSALLSAVAYDCLIFALTTGLINIDSLLGSQQLNFPSTLRFLTNNLTFFLIAYLAGVLARRLHEMESLMLERQAERDQLAMLQETLGLTIGSGLVTTDTEGRITTMDRTAEALTGANAPETVAASMNAGDPTTFAASGPNTIVCGALATTRVPLSGSSSKRLSATGSSVLPAETWRR